MKTLIATGLLLSWAAVAAGASASWHIPMREQAPTGFDRIQLRMMYPYHFDNPAMSVFFGPAPGSESWTQVYFNYSQGVAVATGPSPETSTLYFDIWIDGDRLVDRPSFNYQAYLDGVRVDNADIICFGPGETDWMVAPGTWPLTRPIPPTLAGDADLDGDVDFADYQMLEIGFGRTGAWAQGDFNDTHFVNFADYQLLEMNFGRHIPEPATICLLLAGVSALLGSRRTQR